MIKFQTENIGYCLDEIMLQMQYHALDTKDLTPETPDGDWDLYRTLDDAGALCLVTAREEEVLVGYMAFVINTHINHRKILYGCSVVTYVSPDHRRKNIGSDMIKAAETFLKRRGVHTMTVAVTKTADYSRMLKRNGFRFLETNYGKEL